MSLMNVGEVSYPIAKRHGAALAERFPADLCFAQSSKHSMAQ
jgi:hypothetical protein